MTTARARVRATTTVRPSAPPVIAKAACCRICPAEIPPAAKQLKPAAPATADRAGVISILPLRRRKRKRAKKSTAITSRERAAGCLIAPTAAESPPKSTFRHRKRASALSAKKIILPAVKPKPK